MSTKKPGKAAKKEIPKIVEFFKFWQNPDGVEGDELPIKPFQIWVYFVTPEFTFKWHVTEKELEEMAEYLEVKLKSKQRTLELAIGEYKIELESKREKKNK